MGKKTKVASATFAICAQNLEHLLYDCLHVKNVWFQIETVKWGKKIQNKLKIRYIWP